MFPLVPSETRDVTERLLAEGAAAPIRSIVRTDVSIKIGFSPETFLAKLAAVFRHSFVDHSVRPEILVGLESFAAFLAAV